MWEHAYFNRFKGDKEAYVEEFWKFIDWDKVSANFEKFNLEGLKVAEIIE